MTTGNDRDDLSSTINLTFRYLEVDYVRAVRAHFASPFQWQFDAAAAIAVFAVGFLLWQSFDLDWLGVAAMTLSVAFGLWLVALFAVAPRWAFRRERKFRDEYTLSFSPEGVHFRTANIDSRLKWDMYSRALIDAHSYLLYYAASQYTAIPKRAFEGPEQQQAFEQLLSDHVGRIVRRDKT